MQFPVSTPPHGSETVVTSGNTTNPTHVLVLLHGRGASAESILELTHHLTLSDEYLVLAPAAANHTWYPERFLVPQTANQPYLSAALDRIATLLHFVKTEYAISPDQVVLVGFSQGACLVAEYLKQHPARYQGAAIFSGGLIGTDTEVMTPTTGSLQATPLYIGCDVADSHIPKERVHASASVLSELGAHVDQQLYEGLGHTIHSNGLAALQHMVQN